MLMSEVMADLQSYLIEPERVLTPEDSKNQKRRSKRSVRRRIFGVLVSDAKS